MKTILVSDIINDYKIPPPNSVPDHSMLSGTFVTSFFEVGKNYENSYSKCSIPKNNIQGSKPSRKNLSKVDDKFMMSNETLELVLQAITRLESKVNTKKEIDTL